MSSSAQRKRRPAGSSLVSRTRTKSSRTRRMAAAATEPIAVTDGAEDGVEEVVDLTCEAADAAVVDLTAPTPNSDSVLLVDEGSPGESYVLSSDEDEDTPTVVHTGATPDAHPPRSTPGLISCPVCLDLYHEILKNGRLVVSTKCGHVFCSQCLRDALRSSHTCPTCRTKLTARQYHPLYV